MNDASRGLSVALLCGLILGSAVAVARFAYDGGASGVVVALGRCIMMTSVIAIGLKLAGRSLKLRRELLPLATFNGVLMGVMTYGNIGAVEFISVGLAALLFFTFPVMIALLVIVFRIEHVTVFKMGAIAIAFVGLSIMLGVSVGAVDGRGTALSLIGAFATAVNALLVGRYFRGVDVFALTLHFSAVAFVFLLILGLTVAPIRFPTTASGWGGIFGVAVFQSIGTPLYFYAIGRVGALKTGMATNIQPVASIFEAWVLFDEVLSFLQALGGALVLFAIGFMQWADLRIASRSRRAEPDK